jgi:FAD/FMN-containing dehydrogenase
MKHGLDNQKTPYFAVRTGFFLWTYNPSSQISINRSQGDLSMMSSKVIRNWDGTQSWRPEAIHCPESEEQIAGLIRRAAEDRKRVKAVGGALSWSDIIDIPQIAIRFDKMAEVLEVDRDNHSIRLQAGAHRKDKNDRRSR